MARFRSGTLERSLRRWGPRFPRGKLQRVNHSWQYVVLDSSAQPRGGGDLDIVLFDKDDWAALGGVGVKGVSIDLRLGLAFTPQTGTGNVFHTLAYRWGIFVLDGDDTAHTSADIVFADTRALKWGQQVMTGRTVVVTENEVGNPAMQWSIKAKQRFLRYEEELRFIGAFNTDVTDVLSDARIYIFGRISWETP